MDSNWIWILPVIGAALMAAILFMMRAVRREREHSRAEVTELRGLIETLRSEVANQKTQLHDLEAFQLQAPIVPPPPVAPQLVTASTLSADKRAEALEMLRQGADGNTVSARLQLSPAEAELLEKVQSMLGPAPGR
jgi:hypothetical protein